MKKILPALASLAIAMSWTAHAQLVTNTNNIIFWVGSGTNASVLVLDFQDGKQKQAFAWGYRYNNPAPSGARMLLAIDAADPNLSLTYSGTAESDIFVRQISYFDGSAQHSQTVGDFTNSFGYWGYFVTGGTAYDLTEDTQLFLDQIGPAGGAGLPSVWLESPCGASDVSFGKPGRFLGRSSWDAWVFGEWGATPAAQIYAAPIPALPRPQPAVHFATNRAVVTVPTVAGHSYRLSHSGSPGGPWTNEPTAFSATNAGLVALTNFFSQGTSHRFYRVIVSR